MDGWSHMLPVALVGIVVRLLWDQLRQPDVSPGPQPVLPVTVPPLRSTVFRPSRPRVHAALRTAQDGEFITITGRIQRSSGTLTAPLSGTACAAYAAYARSVPDDQGTPPRVDLREMKLASLAIEVADGTVSIEGDGLVWLRCAPVSPRNIERETAFLAGQQLQHLLPSTALTEAVLQVGDRVWVSGVLVSEPGGEHGYRDRPVQLRLEARPGQPLSLGRSRAGSPRSRSRHHAA